MAIITCITQGKRNKEIAFQLGTTEQVIKNYLRKIYDKLGVSDRLELALYCLHNKIIQTDADEEQVAQKVVVTTSIFLPFDCACHTERILDLRIPLVFSVALSCRRTSALELHNICAPAPAAG
jgi:DNA-binding CsgD family transcriptional regulator